MADQTHADWLWGLFRTHPLGERIDIIATSLGVKDDRIAALTAERDRLRDALSGIVATIESHDFDPLDCDNSGEVHCNCLDRAMDKARAALKGETE